MRYTMQKYFASNKDARDCVDRFVDACGIRLDQVREFTIDGDTVTFTLLRLVNQDAEHPQYRYMDGIPMTYVETVPLPDCPIP